LISRVRKAAGCVNDTREKPDFHFARVLKSPTRHEAVI
jgi:hypothetical protein